MKNKKPIKKKIIKSKKIIKKVKIPKELKKKYAPICVPYSKLNKKDRLAADLNKPWCFYDYSNSILEKTKDPVLTPEQFEKSIKDSGQLTDREIENLSPEERLKMKGAHRKINIVSLIRNDVELNEMMGWFTDVITGGVQNMSFDVILKKFSDFYINKLNVSELLHMRYTLDDKIKEMIMGKDKYNEGGEDIFRAVQG